MKQNLSRPPRPCSIFPALAVFLAVFVAFACSIAVQVGAQKNPQNTAGAQEPRSGQHKSLTPLKGSDSSDGSKVTVTSDGPLNDYSAYRSGDRYYVVIPGSEIPRAQSGMHGRGYEDVQVQKRGSDTVLSFRLKPGASARVNQKFNKLDIVINTPAGSSAEDANSPGQFRSAAAASAQNANSRAGSPSSTSAGVSGKPNSTAALKSGDANNTGQNDAGQNSSVLAGSSNADGQKLALNGESKLAEISPSPNSSALADPTKQVAPLSSQGTASTPSSSLPNSGAPNSGISTGESKGFSFDPLSLFRQSSAGIFVLKYWRWILAAVLLLIALLLLFFRGRKAVHEKESPLD